MSNQTLLLSEKYKAFIKHNAPFEALEGVTSAGKTTVGIFKFMLKVAASPKKMHIIAAKTTGVAEKNIINKDLGIIDNFGSLTEYNGNGNKAEKLPHILYHTNNGDKIIYVLGYDTKNKWENALGGQYGCLYIDEVNTADMEFVREATMRADYTMVTLNPDAPELPVYSEYINCCRPLPEYANDAPQEINDALNKVPAKKGWTHWFFNFVDNLGLTEEKREQIINSVPVGTKLWKNKIKGLRGKATGLVFINFDRKVHLITKEEAKRYIKDKANREQTEWFEIYTSGLDTSYSSQSKDTIAMSFAGITNKGRYVMLDEKVYNNANLDEPIAPSDTVINYLDFLERNRQEWGFAKNVFIDSADQATITELNKYKREHPECLYIFNGAYKKITIIDRIKLQLGWMNHKPEKDIYPHYYVVDTCSNYINELEIYSWKEGKDEEPEDGNDHMVNSCQYNWIPYIKKIGIQNNN